MGKKSIVVALLATTLLGTALLYLASPKSGRHMFDGGHAVAMMAGLLFVGWLVHSHGRSR